MAVFMAMPVRRFRSFAPSPSSIKRLTERLLPAIDTQYDIEVWREVYRAFMRSDPVRVEALLARDDPASLAEMEERFVGALGGHYGDAANEELKLIGSRARLSLFAKARRKRGDELEVPHADDIIRSRAGKLVTNAGRDRKDAIRETLLARYTGEKKPETLVRDLVKVINLDSRRAKALRSFEDKLRADGAKGIDTKVERYRRELLKNRAESIARTEISTIENAARSEAWEIALDNGDISSDSEEEWVADGNEPCRMCRDMDGQRVPVGESFFSQDVGEIDHPPLHPNCYCRSVLRRPR